ncbi:MAG: sigma-54 dependent transcriptional regulator [Proteobacteria bacterium]|nr:sigma-54 dependent transcriptional regulator [Pseudomonadota bacterium]
MADTILIVDDEVDLLYGLRRTITTEINCEVFVAKNSFDAIKLLKDRDVDVVLSDVCMPEMDGISFLSAIKEYDSLITVIMMTAYGTIEMAVKAIKQGAYDFIRKPLEEERLIHLLKKGLERNRLMRENNRLMAKICEKSLFENIVGKSAPMLNVFQTIKMLAKTDVTVLILGETGTGKDLAAQAIHAVSDRSNKQMVTVNCPALPETILESELFGYRKGAFTGAYNDKKGLFDQADGSTIFLDEIGYLSLSVQTKLLRVFQTKEIKPLGDNKSHTVDVRIIAATNQDLQKKIADHSFRQDLYYRLNVASLNMPPLRDIREDIPLLVKHCLKKTACELKVQPKQISPEVMNYILEKDWPGNVRELENTIQGWTAITQGDIISAQVIPDMERARHKGSLGFDIARPYKWIKENVIKGFTISYLHRLLEHTGGNITLAAQISGIKRQSLQKIIKRYKISVESFRAPKMPA